MASRTIPTEDLERAEQLIRDGHSMRATAKQTGISADTLSRRFKHLRPDAPPTSRPQPPGGSGDRAQDAPARDRPPDPRPRPGGRSRKPTDEQLEAMCRKIAKAPAIPAMLVLRCEYCAGHFVTTAPALATELVGHAHEDPELRRMLEWLYVNWRRYAWAGLLTTWLGVPMLHHLAPQGIYRWAAPLAGMPPRAPSTPSPAAHAHGPAGGAPNGQPAAPAPAPPDPDIDLDPEVAAQAEAVFGGMDIEQVLAQARAMGFEIPEGLDASQFEGLDLGAMLAANEPEPDAPEAAPEPEGAAGAEAEAPPASADTDT